MGDPGAAGSGRHSLSHYMADWMANITSIVLASVINFLANDRWTFRPAKRKTTG